MVPAGDAIAFAVNVIVDDGTGSFGYRSAIDIVRPDGSDLHRLTSRPGSDVVGLAWSPDGRYLAFTAAPDGASLPSPMPDGLWSTYAEIP